MRWIFGSEEEGIEIAGHSDATLKRRAPTRGAPTNMKHARISLLSKNRGIPGDEVRIVDSIGDYAGV